MKSDAVVSNKLNVNTVFIKDDHASIVVDNSENRRKEMAKSHLKPITVDDTYSFENSPSGTIIEEASTNVFNKKDRDIITKTTHEKQFLKGIPIRYIKDTTKGSTSNNGNHWYEIQAKNTKGENVALNKPYSIKGAAYANGPITDGNLSGTHVDGGTGTSYVMVDLGEVVDDIVSITIARYYNDGRKYNGVTAISKDGSDWITIYDSSVSGTYAETYGGKEFLLIDDLYDPLKIGDKTFAQKTQTSIFTTEEKIHKFVINNPYSKVVDARHSNHCLNYELNKACANSVFYGNSLTSDIVGTVVKDKRQKDFSIANQFKQAQMIVSTKVPVDTGNNGAAGGDGLQNLYLELQPLAYVNVKLEFSTYQVEAIKGLPPGLKLEDNCIKGSPVISGDYNVKLLLTNGTYIPGKIKVHVLDRVL